MITVENTNTEVRVTIPNGALPRRELEAFLDWLRLEETVQRSRLSEKEAFQMSDEIKGEWWTNNKDKFIPPDKQ
jgi:hypothetical protein